MRWEVAKRFDQSISPIRSEVKSIALVGGSENDSEIKQFLNTGVSVTFLGVEPVKNFHFRYFDLNQKNVIDEQYDLVICSQVLEHIWDLKVGLENLANLTKPNGHLWINCPFSNHSHGSPEYFSAGYAPQIILKLISPLKLEKFWHVRLAHGGNTFLLTQFNFGLLKRYICALGKSHFPGTLSHNFFGEF